MNGVSFAGAGACMLGVLILLGFLVDTVRRGPGRLARRDAEIEEGSSGDGLLANVLKGDE